MGLNDRSRGGPIRIPVNFFLIYFGENREKRKQKSSGKTPFWADAQRQIMIRAAAIYLASHDADEICIDRDCAVRGIQMYRESERAKAELLASKNGNKVNFLKGSMVEQQAMALLGYINRMHILEMSPRDVVGHGLADNVVHAKLLLVILEMLGMAVQRMYIFNGRALQKWTFSSCPRSTDAKADQVLITRGTEH